MKNSLQYIHIPTAKLVALKGTSTSTWKRRRSDGSLQEGIHWIRVGNRVLYNLNLVQDWLVNHQVAPEAHERAIAAYLESLPSNQARKAGRKSGTPKSEA